MKKCYKEKRLRIDSVNNK